MRLSAVVSPLRGLLGSLTHGVVDAGLASLATFAVGLVAIRTLSPSDLGIYAVFFSAFVLATILPREFVLVPVEVVIVGEPVDRRLGSYRKGLRLGFLVAVPSLIFVGIAYAFTVGANSSIALVFLVTSGLVVLISPLQDHMRRMFHLSQESDLAMLTSLTQTVAAVVAIGVLLGAGIPAEWVPFGALTIANAVSLLVAIGLAQRRAPIEGSAHLGFVGLTRRGRWLVMGASTKSAAFFGATVIIATLAGADWLGYSEAARVASQPLLVLITGISAVTGPRSTAAAAHADRRSAREVSLLFWTIGAIAGIGSLLVFGGAWVWNPLAYIIPNAYEVPGLVAVTLLSNILVAALSPLRSEMLGGRRERKVAQIDVVSSLVLVATAATAAVTLSFARPLAMIASALTRGVGFGFVVPRIYASAPHDGSDDVSIKPSEVRPGSDSDPDAVHGLDY